MSEIQYVWRIPPCAKYDIAGMESWLEDMAASGLFLDRDGLFLGFATFVRGTPETLRFRLEATDTTGGIFSPTNDPEEDVIELHSRMGWQYRGRWGQFYIYASDDPDAPELHTDPRVQALNLQALTKFQRTELTGIFVYAVMFVLLHGSPVCSLTVLWGLGRTLLAAGFLLSFPAIDLINLSRMTRLKGRLKRGIPMTHRSDYRPRSRAVYAGRLCRWMTGLFLAFSLMGLWADSVTEENAVDLEDWTAPLPFATVQTLFPDAHITGEGSIINSEVTHWSNWFVPENYEYTESCRVTLPDGTELYAYLAVSCHQTRFDWFAPLLARELAALESGSFFDRLFNGSPAPTVIAELDASYAASYEHHTPCVAVCDGNTVLTIRYNRELARYFSPEELAKIFLDFIRR